MPSIDLTYKHCITAIQRPKLLHCSVYAQGFLAVVASQLIILFIELFLVWLRCACSLFSVPAWQPWSCIALECLHRLEMQLPNVHGTAAGATSGVA